MEPSLNHRLLQQGLLPQRLFRFTPCYPKHSQPQLRLATLASYLPEFLANHLLHYRQRQLLHLYLFLVHHSSVGSQKYLIRLNIADFYLQRYLKLQTISPNLALFIHPSPRQYRHCYPKPSSIPLIFAMDFPSSSPPDICLSR